MRFIIFHIILFSLLLQVRLPATAGGRSPETGRAMPHTTLWEIKPAESAESLALTGPAASGSMEQEAPLSPAGGTAQETARKIAREAAKAIARGTLQEATGDEKEAEARKAVQNQGSSVRKVHLISVDASINPSSTEYIQSGIRRAEQENAECLIIKLNTPGGLLKSTRMIVTDILDSDVPVVVFVYPGGSQSASAGVFITLAAHIAAMAPGTNIGAAHPVSLQGQQDSVMIEKATNDAAAFIRTISEKRERNVQWAEDAVRKSLSITETEAMKMKVIDMIAISVRDLLEQIDGKEVILSSGTRVLETANAEVVDIEMDFKQRLLSLLSDPNIAYILMMLGIYGIMFELYSPGAIFPGVIGGISLIVAFYSLQTLPVNYAGLALIIFAVILFILEIKIVSHGLLSIGGVISLILGSVMLINTESTLEALKISWYVILVIVILTAAFFLFAIGFAIKAQTRKPTTGIEGLVGETGTVITDLDPEGQVSVHGELWFAESPDGHLEKGTKVRIIRVSNMKLIVQKVI